ncbi:cytochrome c [uncultured Jannaschia sp.]|uniref:c-type cytochrome n=1 Tax=uncultured Jannaschia sp. TaxID=293347 RepID=UPI0026096B7D|nr:cytochrome c [uncultured Jannaschia sp.]
MNRSTIAFVAGLCTVGTIALAASHEAPPQIKARQGAMQVVGYNLGLVGGMARGDAEYDAATAQVAADNLVAMSMLHLEPLFPADTLGIEGTRALPAIAENWAGFQEDWEAYGTAVTALQAVAGDGLEGVQAAMGDVGKSCGGCHDDFRVKN